MNPLINFAPRTVSSVEQALSEVDLIGVPQIAKLQISHRENLAYYVNFLCKPAARIQARQGCAGKHEKLERKGPR